MVLGSSGYVILSELFENLQHLWKIVIISYGDFLSPFCLFLFVIIIKEYQLSQCKVT
jgi:hypothetical protein